MIDCYQENIYVFFIYFKRTPIGSKVV